MTIRRVIFPFSISQIGGSHISAFTLGRALQEKHDIEVVVVANTESLVERTARDAGFTVVSLDEPSRHRHDLIYEATHLPRRISMMRRLGTDAVLHTNGIGETQSWAPAAKIVGRPVVFHNRAFNRENLPNRIVTALADRVICISHTVAARMKHGRPGRVVQIDNPFSIPPVPDAAAIRTALFAELGMTDTGPLIGFAANFWERKKPRFFLDICKAIGERRSDAHFVVFGRDGEYSEADLQRYADEIGIADRTMFAGFRMPVEHNLAIVDLLAITSLDEPLGRTPIEAMLLEVPYLGLDDAGIGEIGRRWGGGRLLPIDSSAESFAEAAIAILADPAAVRLSPTQRETVAAELSAQNHAARMVQIYAEIDPDRTATG